MMIPIIIVKIIIWLILWAVGWFGFFLLNKKGIDYIKKYLITVTYFLGLSALIIIYFREDFKQILNTPFNILPIIFLIVLFIINILTYYLVKKNHKKPVQLIKNNPHGFYLRLDYRYLVSKSFEILFQQILIILLVIWLRQAQFNIYEIILSFAIIFGAGHIYLLYHRTKIFGRLVVISSIISALIFPILIMYVQYGFVYSYIIHWIFYISIGLFFWKKK